MSNYDMIPLNPVGVVELSDAVMEAVAGGEKLVGNVDVTVDAGNTISTQVSTAVTNIISGKAENITATSVAANLANINS